MIITKFLAPPLDYLCFHENLVIMLFNECSKAQERILTFIIKCPLIYCFPKWMDSSVAVKCCIFGLFDI